jgi:hypothetical protein
MSMSARKSTKGRGGNQRTPGAGYFVRGGEQKGTDQQTMSGITVFRRVNPDNARMANFQNNMVFDYKKQLAEVPLPFAAATHGAHKLSTMNRSGTSAHALGRVVVGAGEDDKGNY